MTTETVIAKIQLRRGDLDDLPVLDEAELGYATDRNRLFIGNKPVTFKGDGVTKEFNIRDFDLIPNQIRVLVDGNESYYDQAATPGQPGYAHYIEGTRLIFDRPPEYGSDIVVSFNSEIRVFRHHQEKSLALLDSTDANTFVKSAISWDLLLYNTAKMTFSYKAGFDFAVGEVYFITDGIQTIRTKTTSTSGDIEFDGIMQDGRFFVTYKNPNTESANLFYSLELWNTI